VMFGETTQKSDSHPEEEAAQGFHLPKVW